MSNVNNWVFAKQMDNFKMKILDPQQKKVDEASAIMNDPKHQWKDKEERKLAQAKYDNFKAWLQYYLVFYKEAMTLISQHENLVNNMAKWYGVWYDNISNEGKQETELMSSQADMLAGIFAEIFKELQPLKLDIKPPQALNL